MVGTYPITADQGTLGASNYTFAFVDGMLTVNKARPVLTWPTPTNITYGTVLSGAQLNATSSVPGTLTYMPPSGTLLNAGSNQTLTVNFTPTDTTNYTTASATNLLTVLKSTPALTWPPPTSITYGTALSAAQLNATSSVPGTLNYTPPVGMLLNAGTNQTLSVSFAPTHTTNYTAATASVTIDVLKAASLLTWTNPAPILYGTALSVTQLNATASTPGSFVYTPPAGTVLPLGTGQVLSVAFTPNSLSNFLSATAQVTIAVAKASLMVTASNLSRPFGQTNPVFTGTITGLQSGDNISATYSCAATLNSPLGAYPIVPTLHDPDSRLGNYVVTFSNGVLTVEAASSRILNQSALSPLSGTVNLSGLILSGGAAGFAWFEWGGANTYGNFTAPQNLRSGTIPVAINAKLAGLPPGSEFHFRVVASNSAGTTFGTDVASHVTSNTPPTLADVARQTTELNSLLSVALTVEDEETAASDLVVAAWSGNTNLVPQENLFLTGSGTNRTLTLAPAVGQWGRGVIVVIVDDGLTTTSKAFPVDVGLLPGDIDENGIVDLDDYFLMASRWYQRNSSP